MTDWSPGQVITLVAVFALLALGIMALMIWYKLEVRRREISDMSPDDRVARLLGEIIGRSGGALHNQTIDEVLTIIANSTPEQKRALIHAISGMCDNAPDGLHNRPNVNNHLLALARHLGNAGPTKSGSKSTHSAPP